MLLISAAVLVLSFPLTAAEVSPCAISIIDQERLNEFSAVKEYLTKNVFAAWEKDHPPLFVYDSKCQFAINHPDAPPDGFLKSDQILNVPGFKSTFVYYRLNRMKMPFGEELAVTIPATAKTVVEPNGRTWTVIGLYSVWKAEFKEKLESYIGTLAHETFHPFQFKFPKVKAVIAQVSELEFTQYERENTAFQLLASREQAALKEAILALKTQAKRKALKRFFEFRRKRRENFFTASKVNWSVYEPGIEAIEGTAEYLNFRLMTDAKKIPFNKKLKSIDPSYTHYASFRHLGLRGAVAAIEKSKSYTQRLGVLQVILISQLIPNWQSRIFEEDRFGEGLLQKWLE